MERLNNPEMSNTMLPPGIDPITNEFYTEAPAFMQGFYSVIQGAKSRNPMYSDQLPPKLNFWGDVRTAGSGKVSETWNPIRIQTGGYTELDQELIRLSETGFGAFGFHSKRIGGTLLNGVQFNAFVRTVNNLDGNGRILGDRGFDPDDTLLKALNQEINSLEYNTLPTDEDRFLELNTLLGERRKGARDWMVKNDPQLNLQSIAQ